MWFGSWIIFNDFTSLAFDPFPYTFLTLVVSLEAIFLSTFILISQNHDTQLSERRNHLDLQINLLAEQENTKMLELLQAIASKVGVTRDPEVDTLVASAVVAQAGFTSWSEADSDAESSLVDCARTVMLAESQAIRAAANRVADELHRAVEVIRRHPGKVVVTGIGKSRHVGRRLAATLCSTGTPAVFLHATEAVHGDLGVYVPGDPTILISNSGATAELVHLLPLLRSWNSPTIAIVGKLSTPLAEQADIVFDGRVASEADPFNLVPSCSTAVAQSLGNALALCLMRARGFTDRDFARCHPGGQLGHRLSDGEPVPVPSHREQR